MKKLISLMLSIALSVPVFAGCSLMQTSQSPEDTVKGYFAAYKSFDTAKMADLSTSGSAGVSSNSSSSNPDSNQVMKLIAEKTDEQNEEKAQVNGDAATLKVKITTPDTKKIMQNALTSTLSKAMSNAFSSSTASSNNSGSELMKDMQTELSKPDVALTTTEMNLQLTKVNGKWKVKVTENLADAITGGMLSCSKSLASATSSTKSTK